MTATEQRYQEALDVQQAYYDAVKRREDAWAAAEPVDVLRAWNELQAARAQLRDAARRVTLIARELRAEQKEQQSA